MSDSGPTDGGGLEGSAGLEAAGAPEMAAAVPRTNAERILRILGAFGPQNTPRATSEVLGECGLSRATGFALIKAMAEQGLLERIEHGRLRLGPAAQRLAFTPLSANYANRLARPASSAGGGAGASGARRAERVAAWDGRLVEILDSAPWRRRPPYRVVMANASLSNPWRHALIQSLRYAIRVREAEIAEFRVETADDDPERQLQQVDALLASRPDALIISAAPGEKGRLSERLHAAMAAGVAVVAVDRRPRDPSACLCFVSASDAFIGKTSALWLSERLGGEGRIWMLSGVQGASPSIRRQSSALEQFAAFPDILVEAVGHTGWTADGGRQAILDWMEDLGRAPDGVWCDSGLQGVGSLAAFDLLGVKPPPHTGGDLNQMYKRALGARAPFVAIDYPAAMGALAIEAALDILHGKRTPRRVQAAMSVVLPRGAETRSVKADEWAERHVRWDLPDDAILSQGAAVRGARAPAGPAGRSDLAPSADPS